MIDVFIIGAGVSGMTAAIYAKRAGYEVKIVEKYIYGGQIVQTNDIENYPGFSHIDGPTLAMNLNDQLKNLGITINTEEISKIERVGNEIKLVSDKGEYSAKTVIVASGSRERKLGLENEDKLVGRGISYCATCDGAFYKDKTVAVVGGRNTAIASIMALAKYAKKVYAFVRAEELTGDMLSVDKIKEMNNVELHLETIVTKINGESKLDSVEIDTKGNKKEIVLDGLFMAIGSVPNLEFLNGYLDLDKYGYLAAGEDMKTNIEGIFASGDCRSKEVRQLTTAVSDGTIAALEAVSYIEKNFK